MTFSEVLNSYLREFSANQKDLAKASGLSAATVSRYCSGEREPARNSEQITKLAEGIHALVDRTDEDSLHFEDAGDAADKPARRDTPTYDEILDDLNASIESELKVDYDIFLANLTHMLKSLGIRTSELARGVYADSSHISRILSGARRPGNIKAFINEVASYVTHRFAGSDEAVEIASLLGKSMNELSTESVMCEAIAEWLGSEVSAPNDDSIPRFLSSMDDFDLNEYMRKIKFDELKLPPATPHMPTRKEYTGIKRMMDSEIDFMKTTVLSRSNESCIVYSDMPLEEMAADPEFPKKYLFGMAMLLKKGLHINFIHDVNRPFSEMMMGLENYIPMYMTGQISPYYLAQSQSMVFTHLLKVSGAAALEGHAIAGNQGSGKYVLYRSKEDVQHYRKRAEDLLSKALPLMEIYKSDRGAEYSDVLKGLWKSGGRKMVCGNLPVYIMSEELLKKIIDSGEQERDEILKYYANSRREFISALTEGNIHLKLPELNESEFNEAPLSLALADMFIEKCIEMSYQDYQECIAELKALASEYPNLKLELDPTPAFHNINYSIIGGKTVIVSKEKSPAIHFVIHHNKMVKAFQKF